MKMSKINIISNSITNHTNSFEDYKQKMVDSIEITNPEVSLVVFPEYCWENADINQINQLILDLSEFDHPNLLLGSHAIKIKGSIHNSGIYINRNNKITYIPKTNTLKGEMERNSVIPGNNPGVIKCDNFNIGVLICADLWDVNILNKLILKEKAELLVVPAFTIVPKGFEFYAKYQWYSLSVSRSREFVIPIVVSDHNIHGVDYDVGKASNIVDPSIKSADISKLEDFLYLSNDSIIEQSLDLDKIAEYRHYRIDTGLYNH